MKKTYIIINGMSAMIIERANMDKAKETAINLSDHSKEVIVREIDINKFTNYTIEYINQY